MLRLLVRSHPGFATRRLSPRRNVRLFYNQRRSGARLAIRQDRGPPIDHDHDHHRTARWRSRVTRDRPDRAARPCMASVQRWPAAALVAPKPLAGVCTWSGSP